MRGLRAARKLMLAHIDHVLLDDCRLDKEHPILVGVSGGPDSLCLLSSLHETGWKLVVAHFNHALRPEADEDAAAVEAIAAQLGVPCVVEKGDVRQHADRTLQSIETAARQLRYRFLFAQARQHSAQCVAVGHTADDQVETILMHFLRGAGLNGLKGMPPRSLLSEFDPEVPVVRPLLDFWHADTLEYCASRSMHPRFDSSNESSDFLRNRLRNELIPLLETYNPRFRDAVLRAGKTLSADHALLVQALEPLWHRCLEQQAEHYVALRAPELSAQPAAAQAHLLRHAAQCLLPGYDIGFADLERAAAFVADPQREQADFVGGLILVREDALLYVAAGEQALPLARWPQLPFGDDAIFFSPPCKLALASGWSFVARVCDAAEFASPQSWAGTDPFEAFLDASSAAPPLQVRVRRDGDRFAPLGMHGHSQKLSDFFVNQLLARRARDRWPVICSGENIVWVPGYRPADSCRMRPETRSVLHLVVSPPPG